ncbi:hypothetical protein [Planctomicrobium piriforme]|uniref:Uncharacterized protein n=1 Tax=Planctomicrobium piriforme TaxID=1576369 RepID=A0A1I3F8D0_9PLAN|nr:hypothetical protein [Planctomicrobium piriforme]SFI07443.1 hypothetical protein SAMN05421753_105124 [Planctomicrobium piriforme]
MPYFTFFWTPDNELHIAEHGVTTEEFEEVVMDPDEVTLSRTSGLPAAFGMTSSGKYLCCIYEEFNDLQIHPVTAFEVER